ncbi:hypothetical protein NBRC116188_09080 [Oceaniserpentilla sp. 4NH20-0058]|uniref:response regulator n=1 Tax=Oceaniserpentilla sp. 4NH20-0058 TaxID=3127660 RepID=UPI003107C824
MKFLIVDDSLAMQSIIKRSLAKAGYEENDYQTAVDGFQALEIIEQWQPDIVISDWHMPNMTGIELLKVVQEREIDVKIGLVTTETNQRLIVEAKEAGALFVLHKPFEAHELQQKLIPFIQGSEESERLISQLPMSVKSGLPLQLPSIVALNKLANGLHTLDIRVDRSFSLGINYAYLPYVIVLFCSENDPTTKAMCVLDIRCAAILSSAFSDNPQQAAATVIKNKSLTKSQLARIEKMMGSISVLFTDAEGELEVKSMHVIPKPFDQLDKLGATSKDKRLDVVVYSEQLGEGQLIFMAVADK